LVDSGLAHVGDTDRWSEEDMFKTNEKLIGRKVDYDGNPHVFTEQGFGGSNDPHAFRVVGGAFMNSTSQKMQVGGSIQDLVAPLPTPPPPPELQPQQQSLVYSGNNKVSQLTPFFSSGGETPWGQVVEEAKGSVAALYDNDDDNDEDDHNHAGSVLLAMLHGKPTQHPTVGTTVDAVVDALEEQDQDNQDPLDVITDAQITKRSQERHAKHEKSKQQRQTQYLQDMAYVQQWVQNLPRPSGNFKLQNVNAMLQPHFQQSS
jgi:mRNA-decapping enzyme subunit 2